MAARPSLFFLFFGFIVTRKRQSRIIENIGTCGGFSHYISKEVRINRGGSVVDVLRPVCRVHYHTTRQAAPSFDGSGRLPKYGTVM